MFGDLIRATSFAIQHIDSQKSYLKRLKESELANLSQTMTKLQVQKESFTKRMKVIYMPKDISRLIDMVTTFGVTLKQVEIHLMQEQRVLKGERPQSSRR